MKSEKDRFNFWYTVCLTGLLFLVAGYIFAFILFDFSKNWIHPELPALSYAKVLRYGHAPSFRDLHLMFDMHSFNFAPRPRVLSHLQEIWNIKFRTVLFDMVPPHPSFSLNWAWLLVISPLCLFLFLKNTFKNIQTALIGVIIYISSASVLSGLCMMFRPAKVLVISFSLIAFWLISTMRHESGPGRDQNAWMPRRFLLLSVVLLAGFLSDEVFIATYLTIPLLFPENAGLWPFRYKRLLTYGGVFAVFIFCALVLIPYIAFKSGYAPKFENILTVMAAAPKDSPYSIAARIPALDPLKLPFELQPHTLYQFTPPGVMAGPAPNSAVYYFAAFLLYFCFLIMLSGSKKLFLLRWLAVTLFGSAATNIVGGGATYYYASNTIVLISPLIAFLFTAAESRPVKIINLGAVIIISIFSLRNFERVNAEWIERHTAMYHQYFQTEVAGMTGARITKRETLHAWKRRHDKAYLASIRGRFAPIDYSMFYEFERMGMRRAAKP